MAARRLEAAAPANEKQFEGTLPHFFFFVCSKLRDRSTSEYQAVTLAKSFLSRTKLGFEIWSRKWKQKGKFAMNNGENFMESKTGLQAPRIDLELSWSDDRSRLAIFQVHSCISLHSTMYTTIMDRQDTCCARFVWKDARPPLFSPRQNGAKNHWIAWQCTFKMKKRESTSSTAVSILPLGEHNQWNVSSYIAAYSRGRQNGWQVTRIPTCIHTCGQGEQCRGRQISSNTGEWLASV